jgi:hypothetical protein
MADQVTFVLSGDERFHASPLPPLGHKIQPDESGNSGIPAPPSIPA